MDALTTALIVLTGFAMPLSHTDATSHPSSLALRGFESLEPAQDWEHALPIGNGTIGALVYGHPEDERIVLSHARLYMPLNRPLEPVDTRAVGDSDN